MKGYMKQISILAWQLFRETSLDFSESMRLSWKNYKLKQELKNRIVRFSYQKINGEKRTATGTLSEEIIPSHNSAMGTGRKPNESVQCYYDTGKSAWRSFRKENLIAFI